MLKYMAVTGLTVSCLGVFLSGVAHAVTDRWDTWPDRAGMWLVGAGATLAGGAWLLYLWSTI